MEVWRVVTGAKAMRKGKVGLRVPRIGDHAAQNQSLAGSIAFAFF